MHRPWPWWSSYKIRTIKLTLEYDGTRYLGFQRQKRGRTIQQTLEETLRKICENESVVLIGAGRTDSGVHALAQVCHFKTNARLSCEKFFKALNAFLPKDIVVREARDMPERFHARHSAIRRGYAYFILNRNRPTSTFYPYIHWVPRSLDYHRMAAAGRVLLGKRDFSSFTGAASSRKNHVITVKKVRFYRGTGGFPVPIPNLKKEIITFYIEAQSFLYNMVRILMGTLLEIGEGKRSAESLASLLKLRDRTKAGPTAPAKGLFLVKAAYPKEFS